MKKLLFIWLIIFSLIKICEAQKTSYYKNVAPIIETKCAVCHHTGGNAPFNLLTYDDVARRASFIKKVVNDKYMPPWKADPHYVSFSNQRILSESEIKTINDWVNEKTPKGNIRDYGSAKQFIEGTQLNRKPDLILSPKKTFLVKGDNQERFFAFCLPYELAEEKNVEAIEFHSDNYKLIHHANFGFHQIFKSSDLTQLPDYVDLLNDPSNYSAYSILSERLVYYSGWIPGATYESYPGNMGWLMPQKGMILLYMHFAPSAIDQNVNCEIHLFFKKQPIERLISVVNIGTGGKGDITPPLIIPPDSIMKVSATILSKTDQSILFAWPHMHLLGKSFKAYALTPSKDTIPLIYIPSWDFNWQDIYKYQKLLKIPAMSVITIEAEYDNTRNNPRNPFNPPRIITSDQNLVMKTTDEMLNLLLIFLPYQAGDENITLDKN
jgi:hypothetical protein